MGNPVGAGRFHEIQDVSQSFTNDRADVHVSPAVCKEKLLMSCTCHRHKTTQHHHTTPNHTLPHHTTHHTPHTTQRNATQHNTTKHNTTLTTQHNTTSQNNTTQHDTTRHSTTRHNTAQHEQFGFHADDQKSAFSDATKASFSHRPCFTT
jgi:hypothetical protein